jgi:hypothetical protein
MAKQAEHSVSSLFYDISARFNWLKRLDLDLRSLRLGRHNRASVGRQSWIEHIDGAYASTSSDHGAERGTRTPTSRLSPADFKSPSQFFKHRKSRMNIGFPQSSGF